MKSTFYSIVSLMMLLNIVSSRLVVYEPQELKDLFASVGKTSNSLITYRWKDQSKLCKFWKHPIWLIDGIPTHFIFIYFLQIGRIYYNASNPKGCYRSNFTTDFTGDPDGILTPIFLVERGECTFVTKVRNIEKAGGSLAVIIDNTNEDVVDVIMSDDGTGAGIRIPSMLISKGAGKILTDFLSQKNDNLTVRASLNAEFIIESLDHVEWQFFYTSINDKSLDFIKNFHDYQ